MYEELREKMQELLEFVGTITSEESHTNRDGVTSTWKSYHTVKVTTCIDDINIEIELGSS